jgi:endoglucanase
MQRLLLSCLILLNLGLFLGCNPSPEKSLEAELFTFKRGVNISHWLSQNYGERTYAATWFNKSDMAWIADQGFDHIRIPIDSKYWMTADGGLKVEAMKPFDQACEWAQAHGLGVILDMHYLPGASFTKIENALFTDEALIRLSEDFWRNVAARYKNAGAWLRFELINEPVAEKNTQLNPLLHRLLAAVRETNPTRVVYLTTNKWGKFDTVTDLEIPDDPNLALTLHFYEPFPFTHQRTAWTDFKPSMEQVDFPGIVPDISKLLSPGHQWTLLSGTEIDIETSINPKFETLAQWVKENAPNLEIHVGEFGVYEAATDESTENYITGVVAASERHGFGWAVWDYRGGFAIRDTDGNPTAVMRGILEGIKSAQEK